MLKNLHINARVTFLLKCLLIAYLVTAGLLLFLALMLYRFSLNEKIVSIGIIAIYIIVTFLAGFLTGKKMGTRKFLWGLLIGVSYFLVLVLVSLVVNHGLSNVASNFVTVLLLCGGSGMLGGMVS